VNVFKETVYFTYSEKRLLARLPMAVPNASTGEKGYWKSRMKVSLEIFPN